MDRVFDTPETRPEIQDPETPQSIETASHGICMEKVRFSYGDEDVLKGVDLKGNKGEVLALVGMRGGGKSTLANLIPRFFDATGGQITIIGATLSP